MSDPSRLRRLDTLVDMPLYRISRLLAEAGSLVVRACEGRFGITRREWRLMSYLAPTEGLSPSALSRAAGLDKARTSRTIAALVDKRLAERLALPSDRRHAVVRLTAQGRRIHDELLPLARRINQDVLAVLSDEEVDWLDGVLDRLQAQATAVVAAHDAALPRAQRRQGGARRPIV
ncbi:MarR family winged helix-turn-helix transcriptional regulator [Aquabacterium sp. A08]|uniref:MarR family winged helix-turn-helix transcriptional regulator n=1 Tax=Aquabacterium sp. A08 TaxID=2718532 RepID=UPI00141F9324|nr:MarR family transcriptional regulator [Aquabacterium sp. A08]NIC43685.1 MarR family transcriptional regulator [Aquabacterium sp. A08]